MCITQRQAQQARSLTRPIEIPVRSCPSESPSPVKGKLASRGAPYFPPNSGIGGGGAASPKPERRRGLGGEERSWAHFAGAGGGVDSNTSSAALFIWAEADEDAAFPRLGAGEEAWHRCTRRVLGSWFSLASAKGRFIWRLLLWAGCSFGAALKRASKLSIGLGCGATSFPTSFSTANPCHSPKSFHLARTVSSPRLQSSTHSVTRLCKKTALRCRRPEPVRFTCTMNSAMARLSFGAHVDSSSPLTARKLPV
mmetsp:Transcript_133659/g.427175  ORF Transcript_133659/g.427175 Transcript_133659/m.427175 type:complete len:253 (+) Transcript_133659:358-1116(+)